MVNALARPATVVAHLPNSLSPRIEQPRRRGRLPKGVVNLQRERARRTPVYNPWSHAAPAYASDSVVEAALQHMAASVRRDGFQIASPCDIAPYLRGLIGAKDHEVFCVVFLDTQLRVVACEEMFRGAVSQTAVYPREIARRCLQLNASNVILSHNHPSGNLTPSSADETVTQHTKTVLRLIDVRVLDHIIVAADGVASMAEAGLI